MRFSFLERVNRLPWQAQVSLVWALVWVALTVTGMAAARIFPLGEGVVEIPGISPVDLPGLWMRWDAPSYTVLAREGYAGNPRLHGFFPLFPLAIRGVRLLTELHPALAGMLVAQAAGLAALLAFYWLARRIHSDTGGEPAAAHGYALRSTVLMAVFPTAFINYAIYAESLYLMFAILGVGMLFPRKAAQAATASPLRYVWSGLALGLASAARPVGWLLDIIFGVEFLRRREWRWPVFLAAAVGALLSGLGMIAFISYLYRLTGSLTAITQAQAEWGRSWQLPWVTVWLSLETAFSPLRVPGNWFLYAINWVDLLFTLFALLCAAVALIQSARRRFPWSLSLYLVFSLAFLLSSMGPFVRGTEDLVAIPLWGMSRWVGQLFPQYLLLGSLLGVETARRRGLTLAVIGGSFLVEVLFAAWWITGRWIG